ncbi:conserved Plasmodium protein, unknown function [Plasmodium knowlesi strain H]|uniref:AAA+ ATPase domain-containing protein n=3 Tax=Plasmodium knowlesi TaxID=5850 RepID=A0A5K1VV41_PLAKH|nr:conserved Plasmodium protein, unknown function [Plasmodium knowlesi strain H]OTN65712.1 Uncharacterized protein PKNOH_S110089100 [Plasmodium knowlesi]CAA9989512.1 conserved Plasmodium protein, unknown function [Plasmodium knowlesi strain H]SBO25199.1 conserved Plasmodium protein, unknown function [Plasmodium knowlesi strain H]SBO27760.1 conserved Plasmodium protein, unknown function [Plasmodium knowlesi strain H]VVS78986.1 conserved Plasmodium protein, unknown function [Plasmodium knowlesi |eukprot:XP_002260238.1 hypothetical protein, conserved in Plasmodium species [Plasmodium knowlesi strain H]
MMEKIKRKRNYDNARNVDKLKELLTNDENTSACVQCCERNSYETCNNILQYIKKYLNIPLYVLDLVSIYNHENIPKFVKDVFTEFVKYVKREKVPKSVLFLAYFDDWVVSIREGNKGIRHGDGDGDNDDDDGNREPDKSGNFFQTDGGEKKRNARDVHMHIYNSIYYLKNKLLKNLGKKKLCVKLIGLHKTRGGFDLYNDLFDCNIIISHFVSTPIPYYIHMNKDIHKRISKKKKFSIDHVYSVLSKKVDYFDGAREKNVNLFKCFFAYYYKFQRGVIRRSRKRRQRIKLELTKVNDQEERQSCKSSSVNFKWINCLTNLKYFKYLQKYKYFLTSKKKKKFTIFLFTHNDTYIWQRIKERLYSPFFIKEYICTLLKRHTKLSAPFICSKGSVGGDDTPGGPGREDATARNKTLMDRGKKYDAFNDNPNCSNRRNSCLHVEPDPVNYANQWLDPTVMSSRKIRKGTNEDHLAPIRKRFILKNKYQRDNFCVYNSKPRTLLRFYFSKINIPNICLIYGGNGVGKSTLLQFLVHVLGSNYKDISFSQKVMAHSLHSSGEGDVGEVIKGRSINTNKQNMCGKKSTAWGGRSYRHVSYGSLMRRMNLREKRKIFHQFQNVCIIPFENHLLVNKTIGENSRYIRKIFTMAFKNQPAVIIFDNIDLFLEKNNNYKHAVDDQNEDVYKNIYILLIHYLRTYVNGSNKIKFLATCSVHPQFFKFSFLNLVQRILFIS